MLTREEFQQRFRIAGTSVEIRELVDIAMQVSATDLSVLITGESGTGKEVFAQAIHGAGARAGKPFVAVNCGAIPETLLESELFGHERGAFTGAHESRKGFFEQADKGTIFLDEIGEMPPATQVKLLRVLESGEFSPVGSASSRHVDVRVIAATNRDLEYEVRRGNFRHDLYYRLRAVRMHLPPLRERSEDIPILFQQFARQVSSRHHIAFKGIDEVAMELMAVQRWTGNIRELKNVIETMLLLERGSRVTVDVLMKYLPPRQESTTLPMPVGGRFNEQSERELVIRALLEIRNEIRLLRDQVDSLTAIPQGRPLSAAPSPITADLRIDDAEKRLILESLRRNRYNKRKAAQELGISERTLYRKIHTYRILEEDV
jgi:DNA-binding NtrC family response regulator